MKEDKNRYLTETQTQLVKLVALQQFHAPFTPEEGTDWSGVLQEAEQQAVFPTVYHAAEPYLPLELQREKKTLCLQHIFHNVNNINAHHEVHELLTAAGIPYVVIKGCASAHYYPEPELRTMGDVDVYADKSSMESVHALFVSAGFQAEGLDHPHHWTYVRDGFETEVHWVIPGIPAADDGTIRSCFTDLLERSWVSLEGGKPLVLPCAFHHGLIMLLHTVNHLTAGGIGLRHLLDWVTFENSMSEEEFLGLFQQTLQEVKLWQFAKTLTAIGVRYFSCSPRAFCADVNPLLAEQLLADILDGGNFGRKNANRLNQSKLLRDNNTRKIGTGNRFRNALGFLNQRARTAYPPAAQTPLLLPVGWVKVLAARARAVRKGKQPRVHLGDMLEGAKERQSIYEQLRIFEE